MFRLEQSFVEVTCNAPRFFRIILDSLQELPKLNSLLRARFTIHERVSYFITIMVGYMGVYVMLAIAEQVQGHTITHKEGQTPSFPFHADRQAVGEANPAAHSLNYRFILPCL
jgi:ABC-type uncharacterized transport system permease subunit